MIDRTEEEIMKNWVGDINTPVVSVRCITYNHEPYIAQALDGFFMQKTTFPFEVIVHDDASTDKTADIIREYERKYPNILKPIYQTENQYSKPGNPLGRIVNAALKGKYVAYCEGDDYWIDENKLQIQVDFLEANPEYGMCFSNVKIHENSSLTGYIEPNIKYDSVVFLKDIIIKGGMFIPTPSIVYRREIMNNYPDYCKNCWVGDYPLQIYCGIKGKVFCFKLPFAVYRKLSGNSWTFRTKKQTFEEKRQGIISELKMLNGLNKLTDFKYNRFFTRRKIIFLGKNFIKELELVLDGPWYNFFLVFIFCITIMFRKLLFHKFIDYKN